MLKQASVRLIRSGEVTRHHGFISICMCYYPRGLIKELRDEYRSDLGPDRVLFKEWRQYEILDGHEKAFQLSNYEERFRPSSRSLTHLRHLARMAVTEDVYLVCQCEMGERCHREMLLLMAESLYGAPIGPIFHRYPEFVKRLALPEFFSIKLDESIER
jgi:hypothetical protein